MHRYTRYAREFLTVWYILTLYTLLRIYMILENKYIAAITTTFIISSIAYLLILKNSHWSIYIGACLSIYMLIALMYTFVSWRFFRITYSWDVEIIARITLLLSVPMSGLFIKLVMKRFKMITSKL